ncbi:MAG: hypothetical protein HC802_08725 [Caldilineaceae bacterium]|nr:hypothetical protein [Caldilineaceae bacterium]
MPTFDSAQKSTPNNLEVYRLEGFAARQTQLLQLHHWMTEHQDLPAIAISGEQGSGKTTLATASAWNLFHHFTDGIIRVGAAGSHRFRLYDIVRTMDTVFGTTLTRVSTERWGISILEQLYQRKRLLILDELSDATSEELNTLVSIIGHLHDANGQSRVLFIDRDFNPAIADLVGHKHLHLKGLAPHNVKSFIRQRAPERVQPIALANEEELFAITQGHPLALRLLFGLMLDYEWPDLVVMLQEMVDDDGVLSTNGLVALTVETFALLEPLAGPLLEQMVSATGGASLVALHDLFWADLGTDDDLEHTLNALLERALLEMDRYNRRVVMHPMIRRYLAQNATMLGEDWERTHARYYVGMAEQYLHIPVERWPEVDVEWGNIYRAADWCNARVQRVWQRTPLEIIEDPNVDRTTLIGPTGDVHFVGDMQLARRFALAMAHYAFWRHPLGIQRWLAAGATASLALSDSRTHGLLLMNIGRQRFSPARWRKLSIG